MQERTLLAALITIAVISGFIGNEFGYKLGFDNGVRTGKEIGLDIYQQSIITGLVRWTPMGPVAGTPEPFYVEINRGNWAWLEDSFNQNEQYQIQCYLNDSFENATLVPSNKGFLPDRRGFIGDSYYRI